MALSTRSTSALCRTALLGIGMMAAVPLVAATSDAASTSTHVYGGVCAANGWKACELRVALADQAGAFANCTCYESPDVVPAKKSALYFTLAYVSLALSLLMIFAWSKIPAKQKYPNNLVKHSFVMCAMFHFTILLTPLVDGTGSTLGAYDTASKTNVLVNKNAGVCAIQGFMMYYGCLGIGWSFGCISYTLYYATVKAKQMKSLTWKKVNKKQVATTYLVPVLVALPTLFVDSNTYAMYCAVVAPLWVRNLFYVPFVVVAIAASPYILPVVGTVNKMRKEGTKKSGSLRIHALMRMVGFALAFLLSTALASAKRIIHSFKYDNYYETPDAGLAGLTELIACTIGTLLWMVFFFQKDVLSFFKLAKPRAAGSSVASSASVKPTET